MFNLFLLKQNVLSFCFLNYDYLHLKMILHGRGSIICGVQYFSRVNIVWWTTFRGEEFCWKSKTLFWWKYLEMNIFIGGRIQIICCKQAKTPRSLELPALRSEKLLQNSYQILFGNCYTKVYDAVCPTRILEGKWN